MVAEVLGGVLDALFGVEQELGATADPRALVLGDGDALAATATHLRTMSAAFGRTADGLHRTDVGEWTGEAAEAFRRRFRDAPRQWTLAATAFERAAGAWDVYRFTVTWAQGRAAEAAAMYRSGVQSSAAAVEAYNRQVADHNDRLGAGLAPAPLPPFVDPGTALIEQAREMLTDARRQRDSAGDDAAGAVRDAAGLAPDPPSGWDQMVAEASDAVGAFGTQGAHFLGGIAEGTEALVKFVRTVNPQDSYNLTHPARYLDGLSTTVAGLVSTAVHPLRLIPALTGTGWGSDPAESAGRLVPNVLLAVATGGAGRAVAGAGEQAALAGAERTALVGAEQAAMSGSVRAAGRAESLARPAGPMTGPPGGGAPAPVPGRPPVTAGPAGQAPLIADPRPSAPPFSSPPDRPPATGPQPVQAPAAPANPAPAAPEAAAPAPVAPQPSAPHPAPTETGGRIESGQPSPHVAGSTDGAVGPAPNPTSSTAETVPPAGGHATDPPPVDRVAQPVPTSADPPTGGVAAVPDEAVGGRGPSSADPPAPVAAPPPAANPIPNPVAAEEAAARSGAIDDGRPALGGNPNPPPPVAAPNAPGSPTSPPRVTAPPSANAPRPNANLAAADKQAAATFDAIDRGRSAIDRALNPDPRPAVAAPTAPVVQRPVAPPPRIAAQPPTIPRSRISEALNPDLPHESTQPRPVPPSKLAPEEIPALRVKDEPGLPAKYELGSIFHGEKYGRSRRFPGDSVKYFNDTTREARRVVIREGRLYKSDGTLLDTRQARTHDGESSAIYVVDGRGNIYASLEQKSGKIHHSSLLAGQPVAAAGEMKVIDGQLISVNNQSGHYRPPSETMDRLQDYLQREGVDTSNVRVGRTGR